MNPPSDEIRQMFAAFARGKSIDYIARRYRTPFAQVERSLRLCGNFYAQIYLQLGNNGGRKPQKEDLAMFMDFVLNVPAEDIYRRRKITPQKAGAAIRRSAKFYLAQYRRISGRSY